MKDSDVKDMIMCAWKNVQNNLNHADPWAFGVTPSGNLPDHAGHAGTTT